MKYTAAALLLATTVYGADMPQDTKMDVVHVIEGVLMGALDAEFKDIEHCIQDGEAVITDAENAYKHLASKNAKEVIEGLKDIGMALAEIKKAMTDCKDIEKDWAKLGEMAAEFSNPETAVVHIGNDLLLHGKDIFNEVKESINAWEKDPIDYYNFGFNIGKAAAQVLIGAEEEAQATEVTIAKAVEDQLFLY